MFKNIINIQLFIALVCLYSCSEDSKNLNTKDKFGVFEVGMSRPGEIRNLTKLINPHIGVITNIGEAHIENFRNLAL